MGFFSLHEECFICHKDTGFDKHKTVHGYLCRKCLDALGKQNINLLDIKKYSIPELQSIVSINTAPISSENLSIKERAQIRIDESQKIKTIGLLQVNEEEEKFRINGFIESKGKLHKIKSPSWISFNDLISYDLIEDSNSVLTGGIGHALIGGALFGLNGAVAGAMIGSKEKSEIRQLLIRATINNFETPTIIIPIIQKPLKVNSKEYRTIINEANQILSAFDIIAHRKTM